MCIGRHNPQSADVLHLQRESYRSFPGRSLELINIILVFTYAGYYFPGWRQLLYAFNRHGSIVLPNVCREIFAFLWANCNNGHYLYVDGSNLCRQRLQNEMQAEKANDTANRKLSSFFILGFSPCFLFPEQGSFAMALAWEQISLLLRIADNKR